MLYTCNFRSRRHHPMYPYHEEKLRGDDYGEFIDIEEFEELHKEDPKDGIELEQVVSFTDEVLKSLIFVH